MHLQPAAPSQRDTERQGVVDPAHPGPHGHDARQGQTGEGDRGALEVLGLARLVLGEHGDGDVEASQTGEAAEGVEGQDERVERGAEADGEGEDGGGSAEGYLWEAAVSAVW